MLTRAIVRAPAPNFSEGLTTSDLGAPNYELALKQHQAYCTALENCGLIVTWLPQLAEYPDSTFVEDTAIFTDQFAVLTRPGAPSRSGEVTSMRGALSGFFAKLKSIEAPGTLDGGDICEAGKRFFIGISERTNASGAEQLAAMLSPFGYESSIVDIRAVDGLLHLKSGLAYLGDNRLVVTEAIAARPEFAGFEQLTVPAREEYAANCVRVDQYVLVAAGHPQLAAKLQQSGYQTVALEMSEFQKMDGGLSCLSLRF